MEKSMLKGLSMACREAGGLLMSSRSKGVRTGAKSGMELVTDADTASEELLAKRLSSLLPGVSFVGEESFSGSLPEPPFWIVDPLDGTNNFAFDFPFFCVTAAFVDSSGPLFCCTHDPVRNESFTAFRGAGASLNGNPVACSRAGSLSEVLVATGFPYDRTPGNINTDLGVLEYFLGRARGIRRSGSAALDLAYIACGRLGGYWEETLRPWDMAAGVLLVREAGGVAGAYEGGEWGLDSRGVCAAGNSLWNPVREGIEAGRRGRPAPKPAEARIRN